MAFALGSLPLRTNFRLDPITIGTLIDVGGCDAKVIVTRDGVGTDTMRWSLGTMVELLKADEQLPATIIEPAASTKPDKATLAALGKHPCPYCDKVCTSTSGLTLHLKNKHKEQP